MANDSSVTDPVLARLGDTIVVSLMTYVAVTKTYRGKVPQTLLSLASTGRNAFEQYRRKLKEAL